MVQPTNETTESLWDFTEYFLEERGPPNIPQKFLKNAKWDDHRTYPGYYATVGSISVAVEFNYERLCWTEARYRRTERRWHVHRIASKDLGLQIHEAELTPDEILQITGGSDSSHHLR